MAALRNDIVRSCTVVICTSQLIFLNQVEAQSRAPPPTVVAVCEPCHGLDGIGHDVEVPNIAAQHSIYLRKQLEAFKKDQRKHPEMRYLARELSERELDELVVYYSTLAPE